MFLTAAVALASGVAFAGPADWAFAGSFGAPSNFTPATDHSIAAVRIAVDSAGKMYVAVTPGATDKLVWSATAPTTSLTTPTYTLVTSASTEDLGNGWQGISTDAANNVYLSGDDGAGVVTPSKIRKFDSTGTAAAAFGTAGTVLYPSAQARFSGNALFSNGTLLAVNLHGSAAVVFNTTTGDEITSWPWTAGLYVRDVAIKQDTVGGNDEIFLMKSGKVVKVTGGTAAAPAGYTTVTPWETGGTPPPFDTSFQVKPSLTYFAKDDTLIHGNWDVAAGGTENNAYVVDAATGNVIQTLAGIYRAGDCAAYTAGGVDYLYVLNGGVNTGTPDGVIQVYTKPTTPAAAVNEWSLY
jgi:hypothetical protein